jgi:membrane protein required for colicin V production
MNVLDILFAAAALLSTLRSFYRGLVREVAAIAGLLVGFVFAAHHYAALAPKLPWVSRYAADVAAFILIVIAVYLVVSLASYLLRGALRIILLGWVDRLLGAGFGLVEAVLVSAAILMALVAFLPAGPGVVRCSRLAPRLFPVADRLAHYTPVELEQVYLAKKRALLAPETAPPKATTAVTPKAAEKCKKAGKAKAPGKKRQAEP